LGINPKACGFRGQKPLFAALVPGHKEIAHLLFRIVGSANAIIDLDVGQTPLHVACQASGFCIYKARNNGSSYSFEYREHRHAQRNDILINMVNIFLLDRLALSKLSSVLDSIIV